MRVSKTDPAPMSLDPVEVEAALRALAQRCLSGGFAIGVRSLDPFYPTGEPMGRGRRAATFRGGRACAQAALEALGGPPGPVERDLCGAPLWPAGFAGSISHTDRVAAAIVARSPPTGGVGLDLDTAEPVREARAIEIICRPDELPPGADALWAKRHFVIKEAVYKLYWPVARTLLGFDDVRVTLDDTRETFTAALVNPEKPDFAGTRVMHGRVTQCAGLFVAVAALP